MRYFGMLLALPLLAQVQDESPAPVRTYNLLRKMMTGVLGRPFAALRFLGSDQIHPAGLRGMLREHVREYAAASG
jgi:hypothetical protein